MPSRSLVISFPRSGLNWLRHCAEHFSGQRTPGHSQLIVEGAPLFDRTHDVTRRYLRSDFRSLYDEKGNEIYERVALLLRHPFDCFVSHYLRKGLRFKKAIRGFESFAVNIAEFDRLQHAGKAVFYYEDFIGKKEGTFRFLEFLGIKVPDSGYDWAALIEASRAWYRNRHGLIETAERPTLRKRQRMAIRRLLEDRLGALSDKYLGRYLALKE